MVTKQVWCLSLLCCHVVSVWLWWLQCCVVMLFVFGVVIMIVMFVALLTKHVKGVWWIDVAITIFMSIALLMQHVYGVGVGGGFVPHLFAQSFASRCIVDPSYPSLLCHFGDSSNPWILSLVPAWCRECRPRADSSGAPLSRSKTLMKESLAGARKEIMDTMFLDRPMILLRR